MAKLFDLEISQCAVKCYPKTVLMVRSLQSFDQANVGYVCCHDNRLECYALELSQFSSD